MNLFADEIRRNPYPLYEHLWSKSPLLYVEPFDFWMVFDYVGVKRVLNDDEQFSSSMFVAGRANPEWFIFFDPPRHTKLRALVMRAFTPRVVAGLETRIREISRALLDPFIERGEMDLATDYAVPLPMMVIAEMLGLAPGDLPRLRQWSDDMLKLSYALPGGEQAAAASTRFFAAKAEMSSYLTAKLEERRAEPREDLLTRLDQAEVDGERLTPGEILGFFQLLLVAGSETTTNLIDNAVLCLIENPAECARIRKAPALLPAAIEEVLRYRSPLQFVFRAARRDTELHRQTIPAGKLVLPVIGSANRDPSQFPDPNRFDTSRDPNPHVAFGHGIHFCLGAALSRLEVRVALSDILQRMTRFELASQEPWVPRPALNVLGPSRLPLRFQPANRTAAPAAS